MKTFKFLLGILAVCFSTVGFAAQTSYPTGSLSVIAAPNTHFSKLNHKSDPDLWIGFGFTLSNGQGVTSGGAMRHLSSSKINNEFPPISFASIASPTWPTSGTLKMVFKVTGQETNKIYYVCSKTVPITSKTPNINYTLFLKGISSGNCILTSPS